MVGECSDRSGGPTSASREAPDNETIGYVGARVLRFGAGGLTGLWPPNYQTWHFSQIFVPPKILGLCQTTSMRPYPDLEVVGAQTSEKDARSPNETKEVWA